MYRVRCGEVWGGIRNRQEDVCSGAVTASLYSSACEGGKGGDIYYFSVCQNDLLTRIAVADVAGHGPAVSQVSEGLYAALEQRMNDTSGAEVLADLNELALEKGIQALTTAAVCAVYTVDSCAFFAYAGHLPALVYRRRLGSWEPAALDAASQHPNAPLGVLEDARFDQTRQSLESGDRLLLYTDGVIETPDAGGELFGEERLQRVLESGADVPLMQLKADLIDALREHAGGELRHDDVTLLAIEVR